MSIINWQNLDKISSDEFTNDKIFPFVEIPEILHKNEYSKLLESMPDVQYFYENKGEARRDGTKPHSRFGYGGWNYKNLILPDTWKKFIDDIKSNNYRKFLSRLFNTNEFAIRFMWHYAGQGQSVSPHFDSPRKLGSHIFYFNDEKWDENWGGQTVLCFDRTKRIKSESRPALSNFDSYFKAKGNNNSSLLFMNSNISWHCVEPLKCPEGFLRKVFIIVIEKETKIEKIKRYFLGYPDRQVT